MSIAVLFGLDFLFKELNLMALTYLIAYANIYVLWPVLVLSLSILLVQHYKNLKPFEATKEVSLNILSIVLSILIVSAGIKYLKYQENQIKVVIANKTDNKIKYIKLFGRNALTEIDSLLPNSDTIVVFRGKQINYETDNSFENEVTLRYYDYEWQEWPILRGLNRWMVFSAPFKLEIFGSDSVEFSYIEGKLNEYN